MASITRINRDILAVQLRCAITALLFIAAVVACNSRKEARPSSIDTQSGRTGSAVASSTSLGTKQTQVAQPTTPKPPMLIFPSAPSHAELRKLTARYDKFKDQWIVLSEIEQVAQDRPSGPYDIRSRPLFINLRAAIVRAGAQPLPLSESNDVALVFTSLATDWQFLNDHTLRLIADDSRYTYQTARSSEVSPLTETLIATLPLKDFLRIVSSAEILGQLGSHEFRVTQAGLQKLRTFASALPIAPDELTNLSSAPPTRPLAATSEAPAMQSPNPIAQQSGRSEAATLQQTRPRWRVEQVYVDEATRTFYREDCVPRPERAYLLPKSIAVQQGFTPSPHCK